MADYVIRSVDDALKYHKNWINRIVPKQYHPAVRDRFGEDLSEIFGPPADRVPVKTLTRKQIRTKLKAIKKATDLDYNLVKGRIIIDNDDYVTLPELQIKSLEAFQQIIDPDTGKPVLYGLELDSYETVTAFASGVPTDVGILIVKLDIQRPVDLVRQAEYMFGNFDSGLFTGIIGRIDHTLGGIIVDDGQQGSVLASNHGVSTIGVNFGVRQGAAEDARLLLTTNTYKLPMTPFEIYRNQVIVALDDLYNDRELKASDKQAYYLHQITKDAKSKIEFVFEQSPVSKGQCNTVKQILKLFDRYCDSSIDKSWHFVSAIRTVKKAWPSKPITSEGIWALTELYSQMSKKEVTDLLIMDIAKIIHSRFPTANKMWNTVKDLRNDQYPKTVEANERYHGENVRGAIMASAIVDLCKNYVALQRSLPGQRKIKDLPLPQVTDSDGRNVKIFCPAKTADGKNYPNKDGSSIETSAVDDFLAEAVNA